MGVVVEVSAHRPRVIATLAKLAVAVALAGVLLAGMLLPVVGGAGLAARSSAGLLEALPVELTDQTPSGNTVVTAADGTPITNFYENNRTPVTADQIAPVMQQAIVAIEDSRFYDHNGIDVQGTLRALAANVAAGGVAEGGSTLTQQLVKQTLLQTADTPEERAAATEQTVGRKLREARLALALEETYAKEEILTRYLNIAYFGAGAYGIQAAAQRYFSVSAAALTLTQAATLAGLVQSPADDDPLANPDAATARRDVVLNRMAQVGAITTQERDQAVAAPLTTAPTPPPPNGCAAAATGGFFCAYLQQHLIDTLGMTQQQIDNGGFRITTTLRPDIQAAGDAAVVATLPAEDPLAGMFTAVEPGTGTVLAMSVNRTYGCDAATDPSCESVVLNTVASQGSGSTYKVFTAAAALELGFSPDYTLTTGNPYVSEVYRGTCQGLDTDGMYCVRNVGTNYPDTLDMTQALVRSSNTYFLGLSDALGSVEAPVRMAERMGMGFDQANQSGADTIIAENRGSFTLGAEATSPLDLTSAYATLAASGTRCDPTPLAAITDQAGQPALREDGTPLAPAAACAAGAVPPRVASTLNQILLGDVDSPQGTGTRAAVPGHQIAGKTGTSQNNFSATFVGYTPRYAASVMILNPKTNQDVGGFGGGNPAIIWRQAMAPILTAQPPTPFPSIGQGAGSEQD
jgi:membrane peptidoglycan carboxypeptidase